jgi:hypothetical protein
MNWNERYAEKARCPQCNDLGWTLISNQVRPGLDAPREQPISMELHPCGGPECTVTGRDISDFALRGNFGNPVMHPNGSGAVMGVRSLPVEQRTDDYSWRT